MINIILVIIFKQSLIKDPDQSENAEGDSKIMDAMDANQPDHGEGKESDQPSYGKVGGIIEVRYEIWLLIIRICSKKFNNDQSIDYHIRIYSVVLEDCVIILFVL